MNLGKRMNQDHYTIIDGAEVQDEDICYVIEQ